MLQPGSDGEEVVRECLTSMSGDHYLAAIRERIVVFDGGMGATLEEFDLT